LDEREIPIKVYTLGAWVVVTPATHEQEGEQKRICSSCDYFETQTIPMLTYFTLTLNANGGSVSATSVTQAAGTTYRLPTPTRNGYTFTGWTLSGGSLNGNVYTFGTSKGTVTAQWMATAPTPVTYILNTRYESNILNWLVFIFFFGWVWMWF